MVRDTGLSWETVLDELTAPRLESLRKSWRMNPPVHQSVAAFIFGKDRPGLVEDADHRINTVEGAKALLAATGGKIPGVG